MAGGSETTRKQRVAGEVDAARAATARTVTAHSDRRRPGSVAISTTDLRRAMVLNELRLVYQPQVDVGSGRLTGVEALLRWDHPRHGTLLPAQFVDAIATYGMWARVTGWVLQQAIADAATWQRSGAPTRVWVNVAASDVAKHSTLPDLVHRALDHHELPASLLGLELTESGVLKNLDDAVRVLGALRAAGLGIALDDFGTGFSSLTHLRRLPFNAVKIDRSFVQDIDASATDAAIVGAIIDVCRSLGVDSVVEGVERAAEWDVIARLGAAQAQGFLLARPGPPAHVPRWLETAWSAVVAERRRSEDSEPAASHDTPSAGLTAPRRPLTVTTAGSGTPLDDPRFAIWADRLTAPLDSVVCVIADDGTFRYVSPNVTSLLGHEPHALTGTSHLALIHSDDLGDVRRAISHLARATLGSSGNALAICRLRHHDGSWVLVELTGASHPDDHTIDGIVVAARRVSPAREAVVRNRRLRQLQDRLARGALSVAPESFLGDVGESMRDLADILGVDIAFVDSIVRETGTLDVLGGWKRADRVVSHDEGHRVPLSEVPHWLRVLNTNDVLLVEDLSRHADPWIDELAAQFGDHARVGSIAFVVLHALERPIGVLGVKSLMPGRQFTPEEVSALKSIGATIAQGLLRVGAGQPAAPARHTLAAVADADDLICVTDLHGIVVEANAASERILGVPASEVVGSTLLSRLHPDDVPRGRAAFQRVRTMGGTDRSEARLIHADGSTRWVETSISLTSAGGFEGAVFVVRDISTYIAERERDGHAQELEQLALQISQRALRQNAAAGLAELDFFAKELARLFDVELVFIEELEGSEMHSRGAYVPLDSRSSVHSSFDLRDHPELAKQLEHREPFFYDDRLQLRHLWDGLARDPADNRSGALVPLVANGRLIGALSLASARPRTWSSAERTAIQLISDTVAAMFERRRLEDSRHRVMERFRTLADHAADIVTLSDANGTLLYVSPASERILGIAPSELIGRPALSLFHPDDSARLGRGVARMIAGEDTTFEGRLARADGSWMWVALSSRLVMLDDGRLEFWGSVRDIGDRRELEDELKHRATHDPLTDLANRSVFTTAMSELTASRSALPASLIVIDLDRFKEVNDTHGHPAGDQVLVGVAERMRNHVRQSDVLARMGGDEFLVLCPRTDEHEAAVLAERVRAAVTEPIVLADGSTVGVGCSVGVATAHSANDLERLLHEADAAMYAQKQPAAQRGSTTLSSSAR